MLLKTRRLRASVEQLEDRCVPALLGNQLFPDDNPWNQRITDAPVAANSASIMNAIVTGYGNGRLHPDFGEDYRNSNDLYGIPYNVVHGNAPGTTWVSVVIDAYEDESDVVLVPMPSTVVLEGDFQNGPRVGLDERGDSHLLIYDVDNNIGYEFYRASRPSENDDDKWHADQQSVWDYNTNSFRTLGWTSADAAGLPILPGLVRPDEALPVSQGGQGVIDHAIRFTLRNNLVLHQWLYPASHRANPGNTNTSTMPPMGTRFRLKAGVDISGLDPQSKVVAQAMKDYGLILADNGSNFFFSGASHSVTASNEFGLTFDDDDIQDWTTGLKSLRYDQFEVVDLTPAVSSLSVTSGTSGTSVTITGKNFSGAAGKITVLFGSNAATIVTVVSDTEITCKAPGGSGTVDVRVRSGEVVASNSGNYKNPVFGYGTSAVNTSARFTYTGGGGTNQAPTVAVAASASPTTVTGKTTTLTVLGADDGGEANLIYTWAVTSGPGGVSFSVNESNAAKTSVATFSQAGTYTFRVTITDAGGLSVTNTVNVTVVQTFTKISLTPSSTSVKRGQTVQFAALALDQFDDELETQPTFTWSIYSGRGTVTQNGLYKAPASWRGTTKVQARSGSIRARVTVVVT